VEIGRKLVMHWGTKNGSQIICLEKIHHPKDSQYHFVKDKEAHLYIIDSDLGEIPHGVPVKYDWGHDVNWLMENPNNWMTKGEWDKIDWSKVKYGK